MDDLKCKSCGYEGLNRFLELGDIPPVNAFIHPEEIENEKAYPLNLAYCPHCLLVQLEQIVPPEELFRNYLHLSAGSQTNINHLKEVADYLAAAFNLNSSAKILEIGSNDGTLLEFLKKYTPNIVGVDPARNLIQLNEEKGVDYIPEFFNTSTASHIAKTRGKFDFVIALNVIPHTPNNIDLLKATRIVLKDSGVLVMEGVYALETILNGEFDTIYHEHVYTFSLHSLASTFRMAGLKIVNVEKIPTQGGSLRVYAMKDEHARPASDAVARLLKEENEMGLVNSSIYDSVGSKVEKYRADLRKVIEEEKSRNGKLIGLGAPARGVVIMNYCGITKEDIEYIVDDTSLKQGKLTPGVHIPVRPIDALKSEKDRTFILLSWNYKDSFVNRLKTMFKRFRLITPFPKLEVVSFG
ncbi:MAG: class I SAM-dependent methyltransferase [Nanoarchaeota archaeon]